MMPFTPVPAALIGIYTMIHFKVSAPIWILQLAGIGVGLLLCLLISRKVVRLSNIDPKLLTVLALSLLAATFWEEGSMNVHRWLNLGGFRIHAGLILSPILLLQVSKIQQRVYAILLVALVATLFWLQPDASQLTAFSTAAMVLLYSRNNPAIGPVILALYTIGLIVHAWYIPDHLPAVSYVEEIVRMSGEISIFLWIASILSLLLLVLPFFRFRKAAGAVATSLGVYYTLLLVSAFSGNFPVMIMGYGLAPMIGYFIGLNWLIDNTATATKEA